MTEPDVALTDYLLTAESLVFSVLLLREQAENRRMRNLFLLLFSSLGLASFLGGTFHGFFLEEPAPGRDFLWTGTLLMIGVVALSCWMISFEILFPPKLRKFLLGMALAWFSIYCGFIISGSRDFRIAVANYLPSTLLSLIAFLFAWQKTQNSKWTYGVAGLMLTYLAAAVQQLQIAIHPKYFNHNALYHVIQAFGLLLLFAAAKAAVHWAQRETMQANSASMDP